MFGESGVTGGVGHHEGAISEDRVGAERHRAREAAGDDPLRRFEPLAVEIDQRNERDRDVERAQGEPRDAVESFLCGRVEQIQARERVEPTRFIDGNARSAHGRILPNAERRTAPPRIT
jgi:hypothetical protein